MKWLSLDEWYAWWPVSDPKPEELEYYKESDHHLQVPDELAERLEKAVSEMQQIQEEIEKLEPKT